MAFKLDIVYLIVFALQLLNYFANSQPGCQTSYPNMAIHGNNLANITGSSSACCQLCQQETRCTAYTWNSTNGGTCWLKNDTQPLYVSNNEFTVMMAPTPNNSYFLNVSYDASNFFDGFWFQLGDAICGCFVNYTDKETSMEKGLIGTRNGKVFMGVDNTTVLSVNSTKGRNSINIASLHTFYSGLWILSVDHIPTGPGLWPAFWSYSPHWDGEIDIMESISEYDYNIMTLHTGYNATTGCNMSHDNNIFFTGTHRPSYNCATNKTATSGCGINAPNGTYGPQFNQAGGGVFAMEWDPQRFIRMWVFLKPNIPADILNESPHPDPGTWGMPTAYFPFGADCPHDHFKNQTIIMNMALCGWAGYEFEGGEKACEEVVRSQPQAYSEAYWLVNYLKFFCMPGRTCRLH